VEWANEEQALIDQLNEMNAVGVECYGEKYWPTPPVTIDPLLRIAARCHVMDMYVNNFLGHTSSNGADFGYRANEVGFIGHAAMEVAGQGYSTAAGMIEGWKTSSSGHCWGLVNDADPTATGVGYLGSMGGGKGKTGGAGNYWTMVRGVPSCPAGLSCSYWNGCSLCPQGCSFTKVPNQMCEPVSPTSGPIWYCSKWPTAQGC
jgi:uncharacterized protein YkwD